MLSIFWRNLFTFTIHVCIITRINLIYRSILRVLKCRLINSRGFSLNMVIPNLKSDGFLQSPDPPWRIDNIKTSSVWIIWRLARRYQYTRPKFIALICLNAYVHQTLSWSFTICYALYSEFFFKALRLFGHGIRGSVGTIPVSTMQTNIRRTWRVYFFRLLYARKYIATKLFVDSRQRWYHQDEASLCILLRKCAYSSDSAKLSARAQCRGTW